MTTTPVGATEQRPEVERGLRVLIARRLPVFAFAWLATFTGWSAMIVLQSRAAFRPIALTLGFQLAALLSAHAVARWEASRRFVLPATLAACVFVGLSSTALFVILRAQAEIAAFVLLTLDVLPALLFAWGWWVEAILFGFTLVPFLFAVPFMRLLIDPIEFTAALVMGTVLSLITAELSWRAFRLASYRREAERRARRELVASRDAYRDLAEHAPELIYVLDLEGRLTYVNAACARFFREPASAVIGRSYRDVMTANPANPDVLADVRSLLAGKPVPTRVVEVRAGNRLRWVESRASAVFGSAGQVVGLTGVARDVTERRAVEQALRVSLERLAENEERLRLLTQRQVEIREDERKRLGFDLHDNVCQELVGIGMLVEAVRRRLSPISAGISAEFDRIGAYVNHLGEHLRMLAHDLRPMQLGDLGLEGSLRALADGSTSRDITVTVRFATPIPRLPEKAEMAIYRIAQEAVANAVRHAAAHAVVVKLEATDGRLRLKVQDDGRGFRPEDGRRARRLGLTSMEERALALGARFDLWSEPGRGTVVSLEFPVTPEAPASAA